MRLDSGWTHLTEIQRLQKRVTGVIDDFPKDNREDLALIKAYKAGNENAGKALVENYLDIISVIYNNPSNPPKMRKPDGAKFITRPPAPNLYDKEDILQEILYQFFVLIQEYDEDYGLPFYALVKGKLFLRFHNNYYREYFSIKSKECEYTDELEGYYTKLKEQDQEEVPPRRPSDYPQLYEALDKLSNKQRQVVEMSVVKGWDSSFIAEELGMKNSTVRVHLKRGLDKLKTLLGAEVA